MTTGEQSPTMSAPVQRPRRRGTPIVFPALLIIGGALLLASNLGLITWGFWGSIWHLWPVILILLGIEVIFTGRGGWSALGSAIGVVCIVALIAVVGFFVGPNLGWEGPAWAWSNGPGQQWGVVNGSGNVVSEDLNVRDFDNVEIAGPFEVEIVPSDSHSVILTVDDNIRDRVEVSKQGRTLALRLRNVTFVGNKTLKVKIATPELTRLNTSGACRTTFQGFKSAQDLSLLLSGASSLRGDVQARNVTLEPSGACQVDLAGSANDIRVSASGASRVNMKDFTVSTANVQMSGACGGELTVTERLDCELSGASWLSYYGNPTLGRTETSGGSGLRHK